MKKMLKPRPQPSSTAFGLLLMRVVVGAAMVVHGWPKIQDPMGWWPGEIPPFPEWAMAVAAVGEFLGGIGLALGFLTPIAALGIVATMGGAVKYHFDQGDAWIAAGGSSYELPLFYAVVAFALLVTGPGRISIDQMISDRGAK